MRAAGEADLSTSVALSREMAAELCAPTGCAWYHGAWPTLRLLGLVAEPRRNAPFFTASLLDAATAANERGRGFDVLVSGAADSGMLELVLDALDRPGSERTEPRLTVLDRCATPVRLSAAFAATRDQAIEEWVTDVFHVDGKRSFDAVITHGLFGLIPEADRAELASRWASLVRPGGRLITTSSLSGPDAPAETTFSPDAVDAFAAAAKLAAGPSRWAEPVCTPAHAEALARQWAEHVRAYPVRTEADIEVLLASAGFDVDITVREVEGRLGSAKVGPWTARTGRYAEIVAVRR